MSQRGEELKYSDDKTGMVQPEYDTKKRRATMPGRKLSNTENS